MNELALYAGVGGGILGSKLIGAKTVCYVEWEEQAAEKLEARISDGVIDDAPIWTNARTFDGRPWAGRVDLVTGGFPCQPFSSAGKGAGEDDPRDMWPATNRIIGEIRPKMFLLENVASLTGFDYFGAILRDLAAAGYLVWWGCLSAAAVGAPHKRNRVWIIGSDASCNGQLPLAFADA